MGVNAIGIAPRGIWKLEVDEVLKVVELFVVMKGAGVNIG